MKFEFSIFNITENRMPIKTTSTEYWIILTGKGTFHSREATYELNAHDLLHMPKNIDGYYEKESQTSIGAIKIFDCIESNTNIDVTSGAHTEFIRRAFFFALDLQGYNYPNRKAVDNTINQLMAELLLTVNMYKEPVNPTLYRLINDINLNFKDPYYDVSAVLDNTGYSASYLRKLFKKETGCPPQEFINNRRIEYAKYLMKRTAGKQSIKEVAYASGFADPYYFSRLFKKKVGINPKEYFMECSEE